MSYVDMLFCLALLSQVVGITGMLYFRRLWLRAERVADDFDDEAQYLAESVERLLRERDDLGCYLDEVIGDRDTAYEELAQIADDFEVYDHELVCEQGTCNDECPFEDALDAREIGHLEYAPSYPRSGCIADHSDMTECPFC